MSLCEQCEDFPCTVCGHEACPECEDFCDHPDCITYDAKRHGTRTHECVFARCPAGCVRGQASN